MTEDHKESPKRKKGVNVDAATSERAGIGGLLETGLRRFRTASYMIALIPLFVVGILGMGISATPAVYFFNFITDLAEPLPELLYYLILSSTLVTCVI